MRALVSMVSISKQIALPLRPYKLYGKVNHRISSSRVPCYCLWIKWRTIRVPEIADVSRIRWFALSRVAPITILQLRQQHSWHYIIEERWQLGSRYTMRIRCQCYAWVCRKCKVFDEWPISHCTWKLMHQ